MNAQQAAFDKLSKLKVGALFMEMGTGKTKVALDLMASKASKVEAFVWICPYSTKQEIEAERLKWHPELPLTIIGVETISQSDRSYLQLLDAVNSKKAFLTVDESLKIKNVSAKRTDRVLRLGQFAKYRLILNGTPLSKNVLDLWPQMEFLSPKILNMSFAEFRNSYCEYYVRGKLKNKVKRQCNIPHLISKIRPYVFDSALDLGLDKERRSVSYCLDDPDEYEAIKWRYIGDGSDVSFFSLATALQHHYCSSKSKLNALECLLNRIPDQCVVFVKFLDSIPEGAPAITGDMATSERREILKRFEAGQFKVLFMTYGVGAFGLNLQWCHTAVFADHVFDYAQRIQAEARIYRLGQLHPVEYWDLNCEVGLDRLIRASLGKKSDLLTEVKKEIEKGGREQLLKNL